MSSPGEAGAGRGSSIAVVIPLFNKADVVGRALTSVLGQTRPAAEIVVVDDGSTDDGPRRVLAGAGRVVRLVRQPNLGAAAARNRGVREVRADVVAFLDADDEWSPEFLATIERLRRRWPDCGLYATSYLRREDDGTLRAPVVNALPAAGWEGVLEDYFRVASVSDPPVCSSAVAVARSALLAVGGFPQGIPAGEDLLTWARVAAAHDVAFCNRPLAIVHGDLPREERPRREPAREDPVGDGLRALLGAARGRRRGSLGRYLALWHRMRAAMFMRMGLRRETAAEVARALRSHPGEIRAAAYLALVALPAGLRGRVLRRLAAWKVARRGEVVEGEQWRGGARPRVPEPAPGRRARGNVPGTGGRRE